MRKIRRIAAAAVFAAAMVIPMSSAAPAHAVCYYSLEGSQTCGDCMDDKLEKILNKVGIEVYCLA